MFLFVQKINKDIVTAAVLIFFRLYDDRKRTSIKICWWRGLGFVYGIAHGLMTCYF